MNVYERFEHAGLIVDIVSDDDPVNDPQDNDNVGKIYSWSRDFSGDKDISEPDMRKTCDRCGGRGYIAWEEYVGGPAMPDEDGEMVCPECETIGEVDTEDLGAWFADYYNAALTIPLRFSDYGSGGARLYLDDDEPNCALVFTQAEIEKEWPIPASNPEDRPESMRDYVGGIDDARVYAAARINELDEWLQGYVFGIIVRERNPETEVEDDDAGEVLESCWGFIGDPAGKSGEYIYQEARAMAEGCARVVEHERELAYEWACRDVETV